MRKRRIHFYGHLFRMNTTRLSKRIFDFFNNKKTKITWFKEVEKDLEELKITKTMLLDGRAKMILKGDEIRFKNRNLEKRKRNISDEERKRRSERMKKFWENKKK